MDDGSYLPRNGFLRGVLAGVAVACIIFLTLGVVFPTGSQDVDPLDASQPAVTTEENSVVADILESAPDIVAAEGDEEDTPDIPADVAPPPSDIPPETEITADDSDIEAPDVEQTTADTTSAPMIVAPTIDSDETSSGLNTVNNGPSAPTLPSVAQPPSLGTTEQVVTNTVTNTQSTSRPSVGLDTAGQTIVAPNNSGQIQPTTLPPSTTAFATYSMPSNDTEDKPLVSLIFIVKNITEAQAVIDLGAPFSLAIDSTNPNAAKIIEAYRAIDGESVLMLAADGPHALDGGDVAATTARLVEVLNNAHGVIGILEGPGRSLAKDPVLTAKVLEVLEPNGHSVITSTKDATNNVITLANELGVPAASFHGRIDTEVGKLYVIREMDNAVVRAKANNTDVVIGVATEDTLAALKFWLRSLKAQEVTMAPVSAVIRRK
ncbi:MAG: divergent polysaccharide deacetylase family protein [Paracoccaceae bacterium]